MSFTRVGQFGRVIRLAATLAVSAAGVLVATSATAGAARASSSSFSKNLTITVAPGTLGSVHWTVPAADSFELGSFTVAMLPGSHPADQLRVQVLKPGAKMPTNLEVVDLREMKYKTFRATLATPVVLPAGDELALTVVCDTGNPACQARLGFSGVLVASSTHTSDFSSGLEAVVAPGTSTRVTWTVPAGHTYALTDLVLTSPGAAGFPLGGTVTVVVSTPAGKHTTIFSTSISKLAAAPVDDRLKAALSLPAKDVLSLALSCNNKQPACDAALLFSGQLK
jgi:hypothetical protein